MHRNDTSNTSINVLVVFLEFVYPTMEININTINVVCITQNRKIYKLIPINVICIYLNGNQFPILIQMEIIKSYNYPQCK